MNRALASGGSTEVEHPPRQPKVEGSSPATSAGAKGEIAKKMSAVFYLFKNIFLMTLKMHNDIQHNDTRHKRLICVTQHP
jgi:hypothetical protein